MAFYLGKDTTTSAPVAYESKHLTTHGLIFGMTGSGKTGLAIALLEEAQRAQIPVIAIDPKGDLGNLALCWPDLSPRNFAVWLDPGRLDGQSPLDAAAPLAENWRAGLERDGLGPNDMTAMRQRSHVTIYTPGSTAGVPVSLLDRFEPPPGYAGLPDEDKSELIGGIVAALLALVQIDADPIQSREYILLANLLREAWHRGESLDLQTIVGRVTEPPFAKLGVFELDEFFPPKKRRDFAMQLNGLIASPGFEAWRTGAPLDIERLFKKDAAGARTSIFSIAHLDDSERMSFVTLLLDRIIAWMRAQSGTGELRALLYMDEVFGYLPPHPGNPPSKRPILTLLKQARAFGLGVLLATQNPVDVDYKALTNAGTWLIGKLQTEQDKERILDGLMSAQTASTPVSRSEISRRISSLEGRQFLLQNAHTAAQQTFRTRYCMSYLRGPLTRQEITRLKDANFYNLPETAPLAPPATRTAAPAPQKPAPEPPRAAPPTGALVGEIVSPPSAPQPTAGWPSAPKTPSFRPRAASTIDTRYLWPHLLQRPNVAAAVNAAAPSTGDGPRLLRPALYAEVRAFSAARILGRPSSNQGTELGTLRRLAFPLGTSPGALRWLPLGPYDLMATELAFDAPEGYEHLSLPAWVQSPADCERAKDRLRADIAASERMVVPFCPALNRFGEPNETVDDFRHRLAIELGRATKSALGKVTTTRDMQAAHFDKKLAELKALLEMDRNELAFLKQSGDDEAFKKAQVRARFRLEKYKELQASRETFVGAAERDLADIELSALDKLDTLEYRELTLESRGLELLFFGLVWVPNR